MTGQQEAEPFIDNGTINKFAYRMRHPFEYDEARARRYRVWERNLDDIIDLVGGECKIDVELFEVLDTRYIARFFLVASQPRN